MTQAAVTQTAAVTTEISNSKDDSNNMTTHNSRNAGRVYIMVSTHRDLCCFWACLHYKGLYCTCTWTCLHHRGRSCTLTCLHCRGLPFFWRCLHYRGLSCIWTCLRYRSLCCTWTCLHHKGPELHLDLSTLQRAVQLLEVSTLRGLSCLWTCLHFSGLCWSWTA